MRLVFMGTPIFVTPVLEALLNARGIEVVGVYTPPDRPRGRGLSPACSPVKEFATGRGLPVLQPTSFRSEKVQRDLAGLRPDAIVVAAYGKLLPQPVLDLAAGGCLNLHPSMLPRYRGASPVATAILDGVETTGVTLMLLDEGMDTGPIISQKELHLSGGETADQLTGALFALGAELLLRDLEQWLSGQLPANPQDHEAATVTRKLERDHGKVNWNLPAVVLERQRRAYTPWPGLFTNWDGKLLKLIDVTTLSASSAPGTAPGVATSLASGGMVLGVGTGDGILGINLVQLEGRRVQPAGEFLRGYPQFVGTQM